MRRALLSLALASGAALGACGGSGGGATVANAPATTAKTLTTPLKVNTNPTTTPGSATVTTTTPTATTPTTTGSGSGGASAGAGAGDEQPIRVPATYTFAASGLKPSTISVPAFLTVALTVVSADGKAHDVTVQTDHGAKTLHVAAGGRASVLVTGMKRGTYEVSADGAAAKAKLVVGVEPGP